MDKKKWIKWIGVTMTLAIVHALIPHQNLMLHIFFRLGYLPLIIYAALHGGKKAGMIASIAVSFVFLPHFFFVNATREFMAGTIAALILFNFTGFFVGVFKESLEIDLSRRKQQKQVILTTDVNRQKVLFYFDDTPLSLSTAQWFGTHFNSLEISLTLFSIYTKEGEENAKPAKKLLPTPFSKDSIEKRLHEIEYVLINNGFLPEKIVFHIVPRPPMKLISEIVVEVAAQKGCNLMLLPKHEKTKSEEFLFGDTAIQLLRKASIPVLAVKGTQEKTV